MLRPHTQQLIKERCHNAQRLAIQALCGIFIARMSRSNPLFALRFGFADIGDALTACSVFEMIQDYLSDHLQSTREIVSLTVSAAIALSVSVCSCTVLTTIKGV
jgi:hypothetical protein